MLLVARAQVMAILKMVELMTKTLETVVPEMVDPMMGTPTLFRQELRSLSTHPQTTV